MKKTNWKLALVVGAAALAVAAAAVALIVTNHDRAPGDGLPDAVAPSVSVPVYTTEPEPEATPAPTQPGPPERVTFVGDSIMVAAESQLYNYIPDCVVDAKEVAGQRYAIVDGGVHQLVYYGQSMAMRRPPVRLLGGRSGASGAGEAPWNVCGSLCTTNDILAKQLPLAGLAEGSLLAFSRSGAYCAAEGMALFLSRDLPCVVLVGADGASEIAREGVRTDRFNAPSVSAR